MNEKRKEFSLGIFIIFALLCVGYLTIKLGRLDVLGGDNYPLYANFSSVSGLREGANVEIAGVKVGSVGTISYDNETSLANVKLYINQDVTLSDDSIASVKTAGLIGEKYIGIVPGGSLDELQAEDTIFDTEAALDIEALIGNYVFGSVN